MLYIRSLLSDLTICQSLSSLILSWFFSYLGIALLLLCASAHHYLELCLVQRHQAEVEAREETAEAEEDTEEDHAGPGWQQWPPGKYLNIKYCNHGRSSFMNILLLMFFHEK